MNNSVTKSFYINCPNTIFIWAVFFTLLFSNASIAQETSIVHYQRSEKLEELVFPNEFFRSDLFDIFVPDSVYSAGQITIKKLSFSDLKIAGFFSFSNNIYKNVVYTVKRKHKETFESYIVSKMQINEFSQSELEKLKINLKTSNRGNKVEYYFTDISN